MRPVCVQCQIEMERQENDVGVVLMSETGPYQLYSADLYACPTCRHEALTGFGVRPIATNYQAHFASAVASYGDNTRRFWSSVREQEKWLAEQAATFPCAVSK